MGDFNAKVGKQTSQGEPSTGPHGLGTRNERGQMLVDFASAVNMKIQNTYWHSPNGETFNQIDYILTTKNVQVHDVSTINKMHTGSDHRLVRARVKLNTKIARKKLVMSNKTTNIDFYLLLKSKKDEYNIELANKFQSLEEYTEDTEINIDEVNNNVTSIITRIIYGNSTPQTLL